jgi:hypothetical protein
MVTKISKLVEVNPDGLASKNHFLTGAGKPAA